MTPDEASARLADIDKVLKEINDHINQALNIPIVGSLPGVGFALHFVHDRIADVSHVIEGIVGHITAQIVSAISNALPTSVDFLLGISNNIFNDVHNILNNLATAEEFVGGAIGELQKHAKGFGDLALGAIGGGISGGLVDVMKFLEGQDRDTIDHFLDDVIKQVPNNHWLHTMLGGVRNRGAEWQIFVLPFVVGAIIGGIGSAATDPLIKNVRYAANDLFRTETLPADALVDLRLKGLIQTPEFHEMMARQNFTPQRADEMLWTRREMLLPEQISTLNFRGHMTEDEMFNEAFRRGYTTDRMQSIQEALRPILSEDEIRQTFLRGIIDRPKHDALMSQHGYHQDVIDRKVNLYYLIPGPQDLIHMGIRNVFDKTIVDRFQLSADSPPEFFKAAAQQGISHDWALKFWEAHWIVPGTDEAFRMFQRTLDKPIDEHADTITLLDGSRVYNIIGKSTLNLFLKDKDTPPYYREKLTEIAYHPLNRIDIRRMRVLGSLTKVQVQRAYLDLGYNLHNATLLADFVERLAEQTKKDRASPFIDGLRRQILTMYVQEKLDISDAAFALDDLGFTKEEADHYLAEATLIQKAQDAATIEKGVGRLFTKRFITEEDARARLSKASVPTKAQDRLIRQWNLEIELNQDTEHFHKVRDLTKGEVVEAYTDRLMSPDDAATFLEQLGYPQGEATMLLSLADYRAARTTRTAMTEAIKAAYVAGVRPLLDTSNMLDALALPSDRRDALLSEWTLLRETRTEKIPLATLRDLVKTNRLTRDEGFSHLKRHRYTDEDANIMLDLWQGK